MAKGARWTDGHLGGLVVGLAAAVVSVMGSWIPSIWADEGASLSAAKRSFPELWALVGKIDVVHAAYYFLLDAWLRIVPTDEFWLRLPSALAVGVSAYLVMRLAREWFSPGVALLAAGLFAVLPRSTWMGSEGRSSAISTMLALATTLVLLHAVRKSGRWGLWFGYAALVGVGIVMHIYLVFLVIAHGLSLLWLRLGRQIWLRWLPAASAGGLLASPVAWVAVHQSAQIASPDVPFVDWLVDVALNQFFLGQTPGTAGSTVGRLAWQGGALLLMVVGWALVLIAVIGVVRPRSSADGRRATASKWLLPYGALPPVLVWLWSQAGNNLYHPRYFAFTAPVVAILMATGIDRLSRRPLQIVTVVLVAALALPVYLSQRGVNAKGGADWSQVANEISLRSRPGDGVYHCPGTSMRRIAIAYPAAFEGLIDITLTRSPAADVSFGGASKPLSQALAEKAPAVIWVVCRLDSQARDADAADLARFGYARLSEWEGPLTGLGQYQLR